MLRAVAFTRQSFARAHPLARQRGAGTDHIALVKIIEAPVRIMAVLLGGWIEFLLMEGSSSARPIPMHQSRSV